MDIKKGMESWDAAITQSATMQAMLRERVGMTSSKGSENLNDNVAGVDEKEHRSSLNYCKRESY
ncbi:MAG TPA: hypothetical protein VJN02_02455 [Gammaproteobacteria bacterium]|nr:hypothetical protein [Gammaproteobacteria bacterium]